MYPAELPTEKIYQHYGLRCLEGLGTEGVDLETGEFDFNALPEDLRLALEKAANDDDAFFFDVDTHMWVIGPALKIGIMFDEMDEWVASHEEGDH